MEAHVETASSALLDRTEATRVKMLGPLAISRGGAVLELPASRKVRALFAYLALSPRPVGRSRLCELLWDVPNDPRGELRWSLSKLRSVLDQDGRSRVVTSDDAVSLDLGDFFVDAVEIAASAENGIQTLDPERLRRLASHFDGDFLEGLEIDRSPLFASWLTAQRRRFHGIRATLVEHLVGSLAPDGEETITQAETWVELVPFDARAQ
ncbi:MAG: transcriptional regulator, partial [Rhizobiaceae bacterium]|nr:transcriptional regulator [Rhizobiaceae bacterium]